MHFKTFLLFTCLLTLSLASTKRLWTLSSPAFAPGGFIPYKYSGYTDKNINPPLSLSWDPEALPKGTKSLALIVDDPDAPRVGAWRHWLVKDIPITTCYIAAGSVPGVQLENSWGNAEYGGPTPPSGTHRYFFQLYAMPTKKLKATNGDDFYAEVLSNALGAAVLLGRYTAPDQ